MKASPSINYAVSSPRQVRWGIPAVVLLLALAVIAYAHFSESVESYVAAYLISGVIVLATLALLVWFVALSGLSARVRRKGALIFVGVVAIAAMGIKSLTRVEGVINGIGFPRSYDQKLWTVTWQ